jgi:hypothetical protein
MRFDDLSDKAWRVFTYALMWGAENGTDGFIPDRYVQRLHPDGRDADVEAALINAGVWKQHTINGTLGLQLLGWDDVLGQSTAAQVETYKANGRKRAKTQRERDRVKLANAVGFISPSPSGSTAAASSEVTRDVTSDVTRYASGDGTRDATRDVRPHVGKGEGEGKGSGDGMNSDEPASLTDAAPRDTDPAEDPGVKARDADPESEPLAPQHERPSGAGFVKTGNRVKMLPRTA